MVALLVSSCTSPNDENEAASIEPPAQASGAELVAAVAKRRPPGHCHDRMPGLGRDLVQGEVEIEVVRIDDDCLELSYVYATADEADVRLAELRGSEGVVAAGQPVEPELDAGATDGTWPAEVMSVPGDLPVNWPTGAGVTVAIIDSPIRAHPDLASEPLVWGRTLFSEIGATGSERDLRRRDHGTHVAGIIAAQPDNGIGVDGLAPGVRLLDATHPNASTAAEVLWATRNGADVLNMSFSQAEDDEDFSFGPFEAALIDAAAEGVVLVAAGGNCGDPERLADCDGSLDRSAVPAIYENVVAVGSVDRDLAQSDFSTSGRHIEIAAPGGGVLSLDAVGGIREMEGTSQAAPMVSGTAALLVEVIGGNRTPDRAEEVRRILQTTASGDGVRNPELGFGIVDVRASLEAAGWQEEPQRSTPPQGQAGVNASVVALRFVSTLGEPDFDPAQWATSVTYDADGSTATVDPQSIVEQALAEIRVDGEIVLWSDDLERVAGPTDESTGLGCYYAGDFSVVCPLVASVDREGPNDFIGFTAYLVPEGTEYRVLSVSREVANP